MNEHTPDMTRAWNDYSVRLGLMTPDVALPLWYAFKAGWDAAKNQNVTGTLHQ